MAVVKVKLVDATGMVEFYFGSNHQAVARQLMSQGHYHVKAVMTVPGLKGLDAAQEVVNMVDDPARVEERNRLYGNNRAIMEGDIIEVDGVNYLYSGDKFIKI